MKHRFFMLMAAFVTTGVTLFAQDRKDKTPVTYEEIYDEPYSINKLFVAFQPLYGELFVTNVNAGFGIEAHYFHEDKASFRAHFRKTYSRKFFDFSRDLALNASDVENRAEVFNYYEIGGTYHVKDFEQSSKTKMHLFKNSYKGARWASRVPLYAEVPCKVRKIYGARLGGILWDSSTDLNRALQEQGLTNENLTGKEGGTPLPSTYNDGNGDQQLDVFTNVSSKGIYAGASISWIKNVAINFDKFEEGIDDLMFTAYLDILYAPSLKLDDIFYNGLEYSVDAVKTKTFGFRMGIDGRFNRTLSWSYGGEFGYRPSIEGRTFFALLKISFPVYSTNLDYKVESFGK